MESIVQFSAIENPMNCKVFKVNLIVISQHVTKSNQLKNFFLGLNYNHKHLVMGYRRYEYIHIQKRSEYEYTLWIQTLVG
jgi:hypothetical protein